MIIPANVKEAMASLGRQRRSLQRPPFSSTVEVSDKDLMTVIQFLCDNDDEDKARFAEQLKKNNKSWDVV